MDWWVFTETKKNRTHSGQIMTLIATILCAIKELRKMENSHLMTLQMPIKKPQQYFISFFD